MALTGSANYFEDFAVGDVYEHSRGRTVTNFDNYAVTHRSMNTAHSHFNLVRAKDVLGGLPERIVAGPCTISLVVGLTSQDMSENAFINIKNQSHSITAEVVAPEQDTNGALLVQGGIVCVEDGMVRDPNNEKWERSELKQAA